MLDRIGTLIAHSIGKTMLSIVHFNRPKAFLVATILFVVMVTGAVNCDFSDTDLLCEEAVAHLTDCCDNLADKEFVCYLPNFSCDYGEIRRSINEAESKCILDRTCNEIKVGQVCVRVEQRLMDMSNYQVCP